MARTTSSTASLPLARLSRYARFLAWLVAQKARERFGRGKDARRAETTRFMGDMKGLPQKLGQYLSMKNVESFERFAELVGRGQPVPFSAISVQLETLDPSARARLEVEPEALAAASIGQVHRGRLDDGREVAVKLRYPGIARALGRDFSGITRLARFFGLLLPKSGEKNHLVVTLEQMRAELDRELDYAAERAALERAAEAFSGDPRVAVPEVLPELSSEEVLTMTFLEGPLLLEWLRGEEDAERRRAVVERLARVLLEHAFVHHEIQADPHPGNFLAVPVAGEALPRVGLLDLGCTLRAAPSWWSAVRRLFELALRGEDDRAFPEILLELGFQPSEVERMAPMLGGLTRLAMRPFMEVMDLREWRPTYELNMLLSSRDFDSGLQAPGPFLLFVRAIHGLYFYARQARSEVDLGAALEAALEVAGRRAM